MGEYGQTVALRGGTTYLYTAWVWNQGMEGGSNIDQTLNDGRTRSLYNMDVINIGNSTPSWQVFTCRYKAPGEPGEGRFRHRGPRAGAAFTTTFASRSSREPTSPPRRSRSAARPDRRQPRRLGRHVPNPLDRA